MDPKQFEIWLFKLWDKTDFNIIFISGLNIGINPPKRDVLFSDYVSGSFCLSASCSSRAAELDSRYGAHLPSRTAESWTRSEFVQSGWSREEERLIGVKEQNKQQQQEKKKKTDL